MEKIIAYLKQLELSEIEAKLYLTLLQTGPISVRDLAASIDIKRTTAYLYIDQLVEKGLVIKLVKGSRKLIAAEEPQILEDLVEKKVASANTARQQLSEIVAMINTRLPEVKEVDQSEIRYYKGITGLKKIYDEALNCSEFRLYVNLTELENLIMPNDIGLGYSTFEKALAKNPELKIYEIVADTPGTVEQFNLNDTAQSKKYFYKFMPAKVGLTSPGILLYDNKVAIINGKGKLETVVLHNVDYFVNSIKLFDFIWGILPNTTK